uniref:Uncharacterized protein n=1 Tax=Anguilla anguilla TaxID=7936 RepID=A0A0E9PTW2_ANGAN
MYATDLSVPNQGDIHLRCMFPALSERAQQALYHKHSKCKAMTTFKLHHGHVTNCQQCS